MIHRRCSEVGFVRPLGRPDLAPDQEVVGVKVEGSTPQLQGALGFAGSEDKGPCPKIARASEPTRSSRSSWYGARPARCRSRFIRTRGSATSNWSVALPWMYCTTPSIEEDPGGRDLAGAVDEYREPRPRGFDDRPEPGFALGVLGDAHHVKGVPGTFPELLPPGQLVTAGSP